MLDGARAGSASVLGQGKRASTSAPHAAQALASATRARSDVGAAVIPLCLPAMGAGPVQGLGRPENKRRNARIAAMLKSGQSWSTIQAATGCSRATIAKIAKRAA